MHDTPLHGSFHHFRQMASDSLSREAGLLADGLLDRLAAIDASWHPNGFAVFTLNARHQLGTLRLHIWPDNERLTRPEGPTIHTHAWHLCSLVLSGTYTETIFVEQTSPDSTQYNSATIDYAKNRNHIFPQGIAMLYPEYRTQSASGEFHSVPANVAHETHVEPGKFVATLMISSPPVSDKVKVYSPTAIKAGDYERPTLTFQEKISLAARLKIKLGKSEREAHQ